jgi:UMF1 family MFS transporter
VVDDAARAPAPPAARTRLLRGPVLAWASWDWGTQVFATVVTTFVFTVWITSKSFVEPGQDVDAAITQHSEWLGIGMAIAGVVVALVAPAIGALADASGRRKPWLGWNTFLAVLTVAGMAFLRTDEGGRAHAVVAGVALLAVGTVFIELAEVTYNGLLPFVSGPTNLGRVSGFGWGAGYIGGIVILLVLFFGFINPDPGLFGVTHDGDAHLRASMATSAVWMALFSIPVLAWVREPKDVVRQRIDVLGAYRKIGTDIATLWRGRRSTLWYLIASAVYRDGLAVVFTYGAVLASGTFGFSSTEVLYFGIAANLVAGVSTMAAGWLDDRFGPRRVVIGALAVLVASSVAVFVFHDAGKVPFWIAGLVLSTCVGPAQAASRGLLARLADDGHETELFGLYATTGRAASFLGHLAWTAALALGGAQYWGILGVIAVLVLGLVLFLLVRFPAGRRVNGRQDALPAPAPERV